MRFDNTYDDLTAMSPDVLKDALIREALLVAADSMYEPTLPSGHEAANTEYLLDRLALAARRFVASVNRLPADQQPVGWNEDAS